jgi:hypothetical protein
LNNLGVMQGDMNLPAMGLRPGLINPV